VKLKPKSDSYSYSHRPSRGIDVTVAAIIERDGRFLMVEERAAGGLVLNQPAGHLEQGESLVTAVIRETIEETGHHFEPNHVVGFYLWRSEEAGKTYLRVVFCGTAEPSADAAARRGNRRRALADSRSAAQQTTAAPQPDGDALPRGLSVRPPLSASLPDLPRSARPRVRRTHLRLSRRPRPGC
jgi:ADP-ribose pyrophosphatase YjhB (NUDIX family)